MAVELPDDVRAALLRNAKAWLLGNYIGGQKRLEAWNDHYAWLVDIHSYSLPGNTAANRRRFTRLAADGLLVELPRVSNVRSWTAPRPVLDEIGMQAQREWEAAGYRVGVLMDAIEGAPR